MSGLRFKKINAASLLPQSSSWPHFCECAINSRNYSAGELKTRFMKKQFTVSTIMLLACLLSSLSLFSQARDSVMALNRKYNREMGIDFQGVFKGTPGTSLILKVKKKSHLVSLTFSENYRFQLGLSGSVPISSHTIQSQDSLHTTVVNTYSQFSIQPLVGLEKIYYYGRFNLYGGLDAGPYYNRMSQGYSVLSGSNYYTGTLPLTSWGAGIAIIPFAGMKYRLTERFSVSLESAFTLAYNYTKTVYGGVSYSNGQNTQTWTKSEAQLSTLIFNMRYLRFLTLNYHF
jgi:hypothetical protein